MIPNLTESEFIRMLTDLAADQVHEGGEEGCGDPIPGVAAPCYPDGEESHLFVETCGDCDLIHDQDIAAALVASALGLNVRRRFDDDSLRFHRVFVARPGSPDDRDFYCVGANDCGTWPRSEVPLRDGWRGRIQRRRVRARARKGPLVPTSSVDFSALAEKLTKPEDFWAGPTVGEYTPEPGGRW